MQRTDDIRISNSLEEFEQKSAEEIVHIMQAAIHDRGVCHIVLSGGETPKGIYRRLGSDSLKHLVDWSRVIVFFCDERCVSPDDPQSNYGMVRRELTSHLDMPTENIHRIHAESDPEEGANAYEELLRTVFNPGQRRFDVVLLGMGNDGHTASLFPSMDVLDEENRWARAVHVPRLNGWRVTLTFPALNSGREVLILASGESKAPMIERALTAQTPTKEVPVTLVQPSEGSLRWRLDRQAASRLGPLKSP